MLNNGITVELGQPVDETIFRDIFGYESAEAFCADFGGNCTLQASYKWTKSAEDQLANSGFEVKAGELISQAAAQFFTFDSVQSFCDAVPEICTPADGDYNPVAGSVRPSVLRPGTGDLTMLTGGSLRLASLFGKLK